jgi:cell division protein FtsQ
MSPMVTTSTPRPAAAASRRVIPVLLAAATMVGAAVGTYALARATGIFALDRIQVDGATPAVAREVRAALAAYVGRSLVQFDATAAERQLSGVAEVADAHFDRAFPHTLKVRVRLERPVAILRQGSSAWLVSSSARVLRAIVRPYPRLPRIWVPHAAGISVNSTLGGLGAKGVAALAPLGPLHVDADVRQVRVDDGQLTLVLASGTEVRLGDSGDLRLKLAIVKELLPFAGRARYVDVSVPERPVAGLNPQVEG